MAGRSKLIGGIASQQTATASHAFQFGAEVSLKTTAADLTRCASQLSEVTERILETAQESG